MNFVLQKILVIERCKKIAKICVHLIQSAHLTKISTTSMVPESELRKEVAGVLTSILKSQGGGSIWDEEILDVLIQLRAPPLTGRFLSAITRLNGLSTVTTIILVVKCMLGSLTPNVFLSLDYQWKLNTNTFACIVGPSGAGKTWYLHAVTDLASHADLFMNRWLQKNGYSYETRHVIDGSFSSSSLFKEIGMRKGRALWVTDELGAFYKVVMADSGQKTMSGSESVGNLIKVYNGDDIQRQFHDDSYNADVRSPCVGIAFTSQNDSTKDLEPLLKSGLIPRFQLGYLDFIKKQWRTWLSEELESEPDCLQKTATTKKCVEIIETMSWKYYLSTLLKGNAFFFHKIKFKNCFMGSKIRFCEF